MATVSKVIADRIIAGNGIYPGDESVAPCVKIVRYKNVFDGGDSYGLIYEGQPLDMYQETEYVRAPEAVWERKA